MLAAANQAAPNAEAKMIEAAMLGDLAHDGKLLWVFCRDCCHERDVNSATISLPGDTPVPDVGKHMKCSKCGSRNVTTTPEQYPGGVVAMRARRM